MDKEVLYNRMIMIGLNSIKDEVATIIKSSIYSEDDKITKVETLLNSMQPKMYKLIQDIIEDPDLNKVNLREIGLIR
jgi:hypothetical protein